MPGTLIARLFFPNNGQFEAVIHDLLAESADGIVNAANGGLSHGGGGAAAISAAAGPDLDREGDELVRKQGRVPVGEAVVTAAGRLPFKGVVHAVGPRFGEGDEEDKLVRTMSAAFLRAHERGWQSLSFPAVSSGIFAVPIDVCARAYVRAVREYFTAHPESSLQLLRLCVFKGPIVEAIRREMGGSESL
ncbi:MAG: macro domain-containing protein [Vicinamibacteria bacterium]|nr:macro domain-containing protein [Vicinamibacteria bacterium]